MRAIAASSHARKRALDEAFAAAGRGRVRLWARQADGWGLMGGGERWPGEAPGRGGVGEAGGGGGGGQRAATRVRGTDGRRCEVGCGCGHGGLGWRGGPRQSLGSGRRTMV